MRKGRGWKSLLPVISNMDNRYRYKPENGKGDHLRQGADLEKYRANYDRIFGSNHRCPSPARCGEGGRCECEERG